MANITGNPNWSPIHLLETNELARGGLNGNMNKQAFALADRTEFLLLNSATKDELVAISGGKYSFTTYDLMLAAAAANKINVNSSVDVTADTDNTKTGNYTYNGSTFVKSPNDPISQSKNYTNLKFTESLNYTHSVIGVSLDAGIQILKMPKLPDENDELRIKNKKNRTALKVTDQGDLEVFGVSLSTKIKNNENLLNILSEQTQKFNLPLLPTSSENTTTVYVNNFKFAETKDDGTTIFGLKNNSDLGQISLPFLPTDPSNSLLSLYNRGGKKLMEISEEPGKTRISGLDLSNQSSGRNQISADSIVNKPTFYTAGGKTYKADENGVTEFADRELISPIGISDNACLTVQATGFSPNPVQTVLAKDGKTFPNPNRVLVIIPFYGQSLSVGSGGVPVYTTVDKNPYPDFVLKFKNFSTVFNRTGGSGVIQVIPENQLKDFDALHATDFGNNYTGQAIVDHMGIAIADALNEATEGCVMRSLFFSAGVGGTLITGLGPGSDGYKTLMNAITAAKRIATEKGWTIIVPAVCWQHGESGSGDPQYQPELVSLRNNVNTDIKAITGQSLNIHFYMANPASQRTATGMASSMAMYRLHRDMPEQFTQVGGVYEGAVHNESTDWTHLNTNGYMQLSYRYAAAIVYDLQHGFGSYRSVSPRKITRTGNIIDVEFNVPNPPLQFKTTAIIPLAPNYGFSYIDDSSSASISSVELLNDSTVRLTLTAIPTGSNKRIRAGFTFGSTQTYSSRPRTNLCDSTPGKTPLGEDLNRFCLTFEETIS